MAVKRKPGRSVLWAVCHDCEWKDDCYGEARAQKHAQDEGHYVEVEMEVSVVYDGRPE